MPSRAISIEEENHAYRNKFTHADPMAEALIKGQ
jgi:hypothetical protein